MDEELVRLAAAPTTRALIEDLAGRMDEGAGPALSEAAFAAGELRAALNLALAGALAGTPPPAGLAARLMPTVDQEALLFALLGTVRRGLADALIDAAGTGRNSARLQGLILFLAASRLDGRPPPAELLKRIRLTSRLVDSGDPHVLVGLAAMATEDPDAMEVAKEAVAAADTTVGRRFGREILAVIGKPLAEALPEEASPEVFGAFTIERSAPRTGRNDPCPCGSGKKYKRCCLNQRADDGPTADRSRTWGDRARFHRTMSDRQFEGLHPLEWSRIRPAELTTSRLLHAIEKMAEARYVEELMPFLDEVVDRPDLPEGMTPDTVRAKALQWSLGIGRIEYARAILERMEDPDSLPEEIRIAMAILERSPEVLDRIEAMARRALEGEGGQTYGRLLGALIYFFPALGILLARGAIDIEDPLGMEGDLRSIEEARDILGLPPHDPAWEIFDLLSERYVAAQAETSAVERNEQLAAEADELRRTVARSRARERELRRAREQLERDLRAVEVERDEARKSEGPSPELVEELRRRAEQNRVQISAGNEERRRLRSRLSGLGSRMDALTQKGRSDGGRGAEDEDDNADGLEVEAGELDTRQVVRIPVFAREFREGVREVAPHVARDALMTAGGLAATDPGAWASVKNIRAIAGLYSCRIGRHRILFRLRGDDELELCRLVHRRDLEVTLKKMG